MSSDLQTYLASKYLTGAKADAILARAALQDDDNSNGGLKRKKKKRKVEGNEASGSGSSGLIIADDDGMSWARKDNNVEEEELIDGRPVVEERRGHFKAKSANSWSTIKESEPSYAPTPSPEPEDESPVIVPTLAIPAARGGLQSSADLRAENDRREAERAVKKAQAERELKKRKKEMRDRGEDEEDAQETVYRDSQGRKIDVKLEKAEKAKQERAKMEAEMKKMEWGKGEVQKEDKEKKRQELAEMKYKPIARYADDEAMNNEMKDQNRWNDPAAGFLTAKKVTKANAPKYPKYAGPPPPPNRFGIPPGYRWDGVIRGNGFESTMMQRGNSVKMRAAEAHAYNTEEM